MSHAPVANQASAAGLRVAVIVSRYHADVTESLRAGAQSAFAAAGGDPADLRFFHAPGAYELPVIAAAVLDEGEVDALVALGCIITGETTHDQYIAHAVSDGLMRLSVSYGTPVALGVLTCQTLEQARQRAGGSRGNKGAEAMTAALDAASTIHAIREASLARAAQGGA
ncbi:MAG: 6,7-dimethyl-8-ribityllumazine synthase [Phycisphaeraceae bacterium]|nr:MAG: 6,7-dimethyl-8-ribityllumazine synthase [Phycisphaeraceae bacterium]